MSRYPNNKRNNNNNNNNYNGQIRGQSNNNATATRRASQMQHQNRNGGCGGGYDGNYTDSYGTPSLYGSGSNVNNNNNGNTYNRNGNRNGNNRSGGNGAHYSQSQKKKQVYEQDHVTIECEKLKETVDDMIDTISDFADIFLRRQQYSDTDLIVLNDSTVQGLNMFTMILKAKMKKEGHVDFLKLAEHHLYEKIHKEFASKKEALNFVKPFIAHMKFAFQEAIKENANAIEMIPRIETKAAVWNEKTVNDALSLYLGSSHVANDNLEMYKTNRLALKKKQQEKLREINMQSNLDDDMKVGCSDDVQLEMPEKEDFYQFLKPKGVVFKQSKSANKKANKKSKKRSTHGQFKKNDNNQNAMDEDNSDYGNEGDEGDNGDGRDNNNNNKNKKWYNL